MLSSFVSCSTESKSILSEITIESLLFHRQKALIAKGISSPTDAFQWTALVSIHENATLAEALNLMKKHDVIALPVYMYQGSLEAAPVQQSYIGILSIQDILAYTIFDKVFRDIEVVESMDWADSYQQFLRVWDESRTLASTQVKNLVGITSESAHALDRILTLKDSLLDLAQEFITKHRVLVVDPKDPLHVSMVTQTDFLSFLMESERCKTAFKDLFETNVQGAAEHDLKVKGPSDLTVDPNQPIQASRHAICIKDDVSALVAFRYMYRHRVSAVGLTRNHILTGTISQSDLRPINMDRLQDFTLGVLDFLTTVHGAKVKPLITIYGNAPLKEAVSRILENRIHHIWIVNEKSHPIGVVTMSDVISML